MACKGRGTCDCKADDLGDRKPLRAWEVWPQGKPELRLHHTAVDQMTEVLDEVQVERNRQDEKWGVQDRSTVEWLTILTAEMGEVAEEVEQLHFFQKVDYSDYRDELIQVAAVAVAAVQNLDRRCALGEDRRASR